MDKDIIMWVIGGLVAFAWGAIKYLNDQLRDTRKSISRLQEQVATLETKMAPFWELMGSKLSKILHSPHTPALDRLLEKFDAKNITEPELCELVTMLRQIQDDRENPMGTRTTAAMLETCVVEGQKKAA